MRNSKSLFLLFFALVLITISFLLISIWGYRFYYQDKNAKPAEQLVDKPVTINPNTTRDSLQTLYNATVQQFDYKQDSASDNTDSLTQNFDNNLVQYNTLRNEIANILKNKTSAADMIIAREKIVELQQKVDQLRKKINEVEEENKRLNKLLKQLISERPKINRDTKTIVAENKVSTKKDVSSSFAVFNLHFAAITIDNDKEHVTSVASKTNKMEGSFYVRSTSEQSNSTEIEVIVLQPNGKVLQSSAWESGTFETPSGKKVYSVKIHFDYSQHGNKPLYFSLSAPKFQKGIYTMQIYHNGMMIGRKIKKLA